MTPDEAPEAERAIPLSKACWAAGVHAKSLQSCLTLRDPMERSPPGSSHHGILQARVLEWGAIPSSRGSFHRQAASLPLMPPGKPLLGH